MLLVNRECVRRLLDAPDPDTVLVFVRGDCLVMPAAQVDDTHRSLVIARRADVAGLLPGDTVTDEQLDEVATRLDNVARDLAG
ncbi:hypothetical protein ACBI99_24895 [Nonomuraea sp. ATR24]|uniref:hypothetical protein n=1 Tax=Nonomuraea TaxID=83681 RepID=UPI001C5E1D84|nr:hypothetical protein [Nonomuraea ceibae]